MQRVLVLAVHADVADVDAMGPAVVDGAGAPASAPAGASTSTGPAASPAAASASATAASGRVRRDGCCGLMYLESREQGLQAGDRGGWLNDGGGVAAHLSCGCPRERLVVFEEGGG